MYIRIQRSVLPQHFEYFFPLISLNLQKLKGEHLHGIYKLISIPIDANEIVIMFKPEINPLVPMAMK